MVSIQDNNDNVQTVCQIEDTLKIALYILVLNVRFVYNSWMKGYICKWTQHERLSKLYTWTHIKEKKQRFCSIFRSHSRSSTISLLHTLHNMSVNRLLACRRAVFYTNHFLKVGLKFGVCCYSWKGWTWNFSVLNLI